MEIDNEPAVYVREKRQKEKSSGRLAALEALKKSKLRGEKNKYEVATSFEPVYDIVDEDEYSERVRKRQDDDWIINDAGNGYIEDGREIFDDDFDTENEIGEESGRKKTSASNRFKSKNPNVVNPDGKQNSNLKTYFSNAAGSKKSETLASADDENLLSEAMNSLFAGRPNSTKRKVKFSPSPKKLSRPKFSPIKQSVKPINFVNFDDMIVEATSTTSSKIDLNKLKLENISPIKQSPAKNFVDDKIKSPTKDLTYLQRPMKQSPQRDFIAADNTVVETNRKSPTTDVKNVKRKNISPIKQSPPKNFVISDDAIVDAANKNSPTTDLNNSKIDYQHDFVSTNVDGKRILKIYLLDACEDSKSPGTVYLFGRIFDASKRSPFSCSIIVRNVERRVWFLPRERRIDLKSGASYGEPLEFAEIYDEIQKLTERNGVTTFRIKKIKKKYSVVGSLNVDAPSETEYIEIKYSFSCPALPTDTVGETFSAVFGSTSSALELFLLEQKIKGPRWLEIIDPTPNSLRITYCPVEFVVDKPSSVRPTTDTSPPPVRSVVLKIKTMPNSKNQHEIVSAGILFNNSFEFDKENKNWQSTYAICKGSEIALPFDFKDKLNRHKSMSDVKLVPNERSLINFLLAKLQNLDPDIIIGHDLWNYELETLMQRVVSTSTPRWDRLGRLKRSATAKAMTHKSALHDVTVGRLICDIGVLSRELIKAKDYDLSGLVLQILDEKRHEILPEHVKLMFNSSDDLFRLLTSIKYDCVWMLHIAVKLQCIPLAAEITRIVGGVFSKTLMGGRAERTEFLLLHALETAGYIYPDKYQHFKKHLQNFILIQFEDFGKEEEEGLANEPTAASTSAPRKKAAYAGGLVLEPVKGLYDQLVLLLDFNSLYPSIMQEYNICFTTIDLLKHKNFTKNDEDILPAVPASTCDLGILPSEIKKLVDSRRTVKNLMKESSLPQELMQQYTIRQQALKITANSMYGCLGFASSRFYAKPLAALITAKGREILMDTKDVVESMGLDVIYGDTDSLMINTKRSEMDDVLAVAKKVKIEVNKKYRLLELEMDGLFKKLLLLKKKKYAGLSIERRSDGTIVTKKEVKGLDIIRRDWSAISIEAGDYVLNEILSDRGVDEILERIHQYLTRLGEEIRQNKIDAVKFLINKQLTKSPEDYGDKKSLSHVAVAIRLNEKGRRLKQGDIVSYLICNDGTNSPATQRAFDISEFEDEKKNLKIDVNYYLSSQIHPVVCRLCEPIDGTDAVRIAEYLGLDSSSFRQRLATVTSMNDDEDWTALANPSCDFARCDPFRFTCSNADCNTICEIRSTFTGSGKTLEHSLLKCANTNCKEKPFDRWYLLVNTLHLTACELIGKYYSNWMICDDVTCAYRTRRVTFKLESGQIKCPSCRKNVLKQEVSEKQLYEQLIFYQNIFDLDSATSQLSKDERERMLEQQITKKPPGRVPTQLHFAYQSLHQAAQHYLQSNSYSQIDLGKLFHGLKFL